jgi:hypothetical protein
LIPDYSVYFEGGSHVVESLSFYKAILELFQGVS